MTASSHRVTLEDQVQRSSEVLVQEVGGEAVLLDLASERYFGLDPVGTRPRLRARTPLKAMLLGGEPLDGHRHLWWNFVSSSKERIEQARQDWQQGRFGHIEGDEEFIPLPSR